MVLTEIASSSVLPLLFLYERHCASSDVGNYTVITEFYDLSESRLNLGQVVVRHDKQTPRCF